MEMATEFVEYDVEQYSRLVLFICMSPAEKESSKQSNPLVEVKVRGSMKGDSDGMHRSRILTHF